MADLLNMASITANTFKKAIEVTSHNVSNVNTEGYHRQKANIVSNAPQTAGVNSVGGGARVDAISRVYDQAIQQQLTSSNSLKSRYTEQLALSKQVEGIVTSNTQGVQTFMQSFFDAAQNLANDPVSDVNRRLFLDDSRNLQSHIGNLAQVLKQTNQETNTQIDTLVADANSRLKVIYDVNQAVARAYKVGTQPPNDLLDKRDQAVMALSNIIGVKTFYQKDGTLDVYSGNGRMPLASTNGLSQLESGYSEYSDENRKEIYMNVGGVRRQISNQIVGGKLGATLDYRNQILDKSRDDLGVTINGMVAGTNWQHYQGWDLNGNAGQAFFKPLSTTALGSNKNTGSEDGSHIIVSFNPPTLGTPSPPYTNPQPTAANKQKALDKAHEAIGQLTSREYEIVSNGGNPASFTFKDYKTGEDITSKAVEDPNNPGKYQLEGLQFDLSAVKTSGTTQANDHYIVKPHQVILEHFATLLSDTNTIATRGQSPNPADVNGTPAAYGDNVNISNIANLASKKMLYAPAIKNPSNPNIYTNPPDGKHQSSSSFLEGYAKMASNVGLYVRGTDIQLQTQTNVFNEVNTRSQSLSGVNLDEEAANLMRFQQAYQAAAKLISTTQQMFTTLLQTMR